MDFFHARISDEAILLVTETLRSGFIGEGSRVRQFEGALASQLGICNPVALNSGTSALHLGLLLAGVTRGDQVIVPAQTFVASGIAVLMCGADVVFADIQRATGNIDPHSVRAKITDRTRAIMPVHWGGYPCDMVELSEIAARAGVPLVEDAAHALGATYQGKPIGSIADFTAFSFQAIKHLTTGDGGLLACRDDKDAAEARRLRWFGIDRARDAASSLGERQYNLGKVGYKYHMNDVAAAIGIGNLVSFAKVIARHREIAARYRGGLAGVPGLALLQTAADREPSYWIYTILVERREDFVRALKGRGIPACVVHRRIDRNAVFGGVRTDLPNQTYFDENQIALPVHSACTDDEIDSVVAAVRAGW
ncbi:MAG: DegT/DnrJ/EryC1/StrS family aminotransferase [Usitatibacter sp.]